MSSDERELLQMELKMLKEAGEVLEYSYNTCNRIGLNKRHTFAEMDKFEALTSRFARTSDIMVQKIFRLIDAVELELPGSVIDRINRAEKRGDISSAETFREIRRLRNDIAHEYILESIDQLYKKAMELTPDLLDSVNKVIEVYSDK